MTFDVDLTIKIKRSNRSSKGQTLPSQFYLKLPKNTDLSSLGGRMHLSMHALVCSSVVTQQRWRRPTLSRSRSAPYGTSAADSDRTSYRRDCSIQRRRWPGKDNAAASGAANKMARAAEGDHPQR